MAAEPLLLSVVDAAALLGVSRSTVNRLIAAGELPSVRLNGSRRIRRDALIAYVDALGGDR